MPNEDKKYILVVGNIFDGVRLIGPFDEFEDADEYSNSIDDPTWIQALEKPE